jgi:DNA-binding PadR family transcriptional regulator
MEKVPQDNRPDRKIYSITNAGRAEFIKWLSGPAPQVEMRTAPLIQIFFTGQLLDEEIMAKFEGFAEIMRVVLAQSEQIPGQILPFQQEISSPREHFFWLLTLDNGIRSMRTCLGWAENVIEQLKQGKVPAR